MDQVFFLYLGRDETLLYTSKSGGAVIDVCQCTVLLVRGVTPKPEFLTINSLVTGQKKRKKDETGTYQMINCI